MRLDERLSLKHALDGAAQRLERNQRALDLNRLYGQAYDVLASLASPRGVRPGSEPPQVRDRYGRHRSGQALLLARRLVEAGVP